MQWRKFIEHPKPFKNSGSEHETDSLDLEKTNHQELGVGNEFIVGPKKLNLGTRVFMRCLQQTAFLTQICSFVVNFWTRRKKIRMEMGVQVVQPLEWTVEEQQYLVFSRWSRFRPFYFHSISSMVHCHNTILFRRLSEQVPKIPSRLYSPSLRAQHFEDTWVDYLELSSIRNWFSSKCLQMTYRYHEATRQTVVCIKLVNVVLTLSECYKEWKCHC